MAGASGVGEEFVVDGVADVTFQGTDRFSVCFAFGDAPFEIGAAVGVGLAELADGGHVDGVVEVPVAAFGEPVHGAPARGEFDGGGAVLGGELVAGGESGDVAGVADERGGDDGADAEDVGDGGS